MTISPYAQMRVSVYASPLVQRYGNMTDVSTDYTVPNFYVHYTKIPSQHFGAELHFRTSKRTQFILTLQHVTNHYRLDYTFYAPNTNNKLPVSTGDMSINTQSAGFKIGVGRQLSPAFRLQASLGFFATYTPNDQDIPFLWHTTFGYYVDGNGNPTTPGINFLYDIRISGGGFLPQLGIPELTLHYKLLENLDFRIGTQLKFFEIDRETGYIDVTVQGQNAYFDQPMPHKPLHFSRIHRTEFNYSVGFSYTFGPNNPRRSPAKL